MIKKKIAFIVTNYLSVNAFLLNHIKTLKHHYDIYVITNQIENIPKNIKISKIQIKFDRKINIINDFYCLIKLINVIKKNKFDITISLTPKAGLLCALSSKFVNVKTRIHYFTGQIWANKQNLNKLFFKSIDVIISILSTHILIDSFSQRNFLIKNKIINVNKSTVLGNGSISGVDIDKFNINNNFNKEIRSKLNIPNSEFVITYLGRINKDKGIINLIEAFNDLLPQYNDLTLLIVGSVENDIKLEFKNLTKNKKIILIDHSIYPEKYMNASNIICLPSYREGFGNVIIEAASCGIPSIISDIYGLKDSIIENKTGFVFKINDINSLKNQILYSYKNKEKLIDLKYNCRNFVINNFNKDDVSTHFFNYLKPL